MLHVLILIATHAAMLVLGFLIGIYVLPILTAPKGPDVAALQATSTGALYKGRFERNLKGSDFLHWGEGEVRVLTELRTRGAWRRGLITICISRRSSSTPRTASWPSRTSRGALAK